MCEIAFEDERATGPLSDRIYDSVLVVVRIECRRGVGNDQHADHDERRYADKKPLDRPLQGMLPEPILAVTLIALSVWCEERSVVA